MTRLGALRRRIGRARRGESLPPDLDRDARALVDRVSPFTMTSPERVVALRDAIRYACRARIPGDVVECGVWRGGSAMVAALTLLAEGDDRELFLYDTFEGMTSPEEVDRHHDGTPADELLARADPTEGRSVWAVAGLDDVRANLASTGFPMERVHFVVGAVEETIPGSGPPEIAVLRLDTDWYRSTRHELEHLYPRLSPGGVLIVDDYGHWAGARQAVDEYFEHDPVLLHRIDYTGRSLVKR